MPTARRHHLLVPDATHSAVLVSLANGGRALPVVESEWEAADVLAAAGEQLGLGGPYLRPAAVARGADRKITDVLHELDAPPAGWEPAHGLAWLDRAAVDPAEVVPDDLVAAVESWLAIESGEPAPELRSPWARAGWRAEADQWILASAREAGHEAIGDVELVSQWPLSSILRVPTTGGTLYFKGVFSLFRNEPAITVGLRQRQGDVTPEVVAVDETRAWILLRELPGEQLGDTGSDWQSGIRVIAGIHRAWTERDEVLAIGAEDRSLEVLESELPALRESVPLDDAERARFDAAWPSILGSLEQLADGPLPHTLVHGDFHPWNVMVDGDDVRVFDWSDSCFAHPLFDLPTFVFPAGDEDARHALVQEYVAAWSDVASSAELLQLTRLAAPIASLHHAISYARILAALEPADRWHFENAPRGWVLRAVEAAETLSGATA